MRSTLIVTWHLHSALPNPIWRLPPVEYEFLRGMLRGKIHHPALGNLEAPEFTIYKYGCIFGIPSSIEVFKDTLRIKKWWFTVYREDNKGLGKWLIGEGHSRGYS